MSEKAITLLKRFLRTGLSGGVAALVLALKDAPSLTTLADLKVWLSTLVVVFIAGALGALDKASRWQD